MNQIDQEHITDLTFIGSGIATSFTIIALLKEIENGTIRKDKPLRLTIVEKGREFHTGIAYGPTSGPSALLITSLADFLPVGQERKEFLDWLAIHKDQLVIKLLEDGGDLSKNWLETHKEDIKENNWEDIYLPRRFFGAYMHEKLQHLIQKFEKENKIEFTLINDEVLSIDTEGKLYTLHLKNQALKITSKQVVV